MKKNHYSMVSMLLQVWKCKTLLVMRLTLLICLFFAFQSIAIEALSQNQRLSINQKNIKIEEIIQLIENRTDYYFMYSAKSVDVGRTVNIEVTDKLVSEILDNIFKGTNVSYRIDGRLIALSKNGEESAIGQQLRSISGKITDSSGVPLPGVSVVVKGTTNGIITDANGNYSLSRVSANATIVFSFVGMKSQEVKVAGQNSINIKLEEESVGIDEVVAIGYGTTSKTKLVSALTQVETKGLTTVPYTSSVNGLAGRAAGLIVAETGGNYGNLPKISIRGGGEPTYIIDGIKQSKEIFALIPPGDIADISVLKDASSAAVYGFDSANGVILVTTKRGGKGRMQITFSSDYALQTNPLKPEFMSKYDKALYDNALAFNDGIKPVVSNETLNIIKNNLDPVRNPLNNPYDEMIKKAPSQQRHSLTVSGSQNGTDVYVSADYFNQEALYKKGDNGLDRYSLRLNAGHKFERIGLATSMGMNFSRQAAQYPPSSESAFWSYALRIGRGTPLFNPAGNYYGEVNGLAMMDPAAGYRKYETNRGIADITLKWEVPFVKGLTLKGVGLYRMEQGFNKTWSSGFRNAAPLYSWENQPSDMGKPTLFQETNRYNTYTLEGHINYLRTFASV